MNLHTFNSFTLNKRNRLRHSFALNSFAPQMASRADAQNQSKMVSWARLPVRYCIMVRTVIGFLLRPLN